MKKIIVFAFLALLIVGFSFAILKVPSTTIKTNTTTTTVKTNVTTTVKANVTVISPVLKLNITANKSNETGPTMTKPELISAVTTKPIKNITNATTPGLISCVSCAKVNLTALANVTGTCNYTEADEFLRYSHLYGHHADLYMPDYLDDVYEDCDLLGWDKNITEDLNATLGYISQIESEMDEIENDSQALVDRGLKSIECLREVYYDPTPPDPSSVYVTALPIIPGRSYPSFPTRSHFGTSYRMSGIYDYVATQVENFYYANMNVRTGHNYTKAAMANLENITLGLEDFCRRKVCVWPEDKDFYESLLEYEQRSALIYANRTKLYIDDARDFAEYYDNYKGGIDRIECMEFMAPATQAPWMNMNLENVTNDTAKQVISPVKLSKNFTGVKNVTLIGGPAPKYVIQSKVKKKMLWVFDVEVETKAEVNAENGQIISEEKPWWSFLLTG